MWSLLRNNQRQCVNLSFILEYKLYGTFGRKEGRKIAKHPKGKLLEGSDYIL